MAFVKKIYVVYRDCSNLNKYTLPCLFTDKGIIISHLRYLAKYNLKSNSWKERSCFALKLLIKYINANCFNENLDSITILESFRTALHTGTIDYSTFKDSLDLYWRPRTIKDTNDLLDHIDKYTDFLALQHGFESSKVNPLRKATTYEQRLNWCAYYKKYKNNFLNHLSTPNNQELDLVREVRPLLNNVYDTKYALRFPEKYIDELLQNGFKRRDGYPDYKSQAMTMLMHYGGIRKSELFHIFVSDITIHPNRQGEALVRVFHPQSGSSPESGYKNRYEYLLSKTKYKPRNTYLASERLFAGWKSPLLTDSPNSSTKDYFEIVFNPPHKAKDFLRTWVKYLKYQRQEPARTNFHPFAFTNEEGNPDTIKNFQRRYRNAVQKLGLEAQKGLGTTEHGHRHAYGHRAKESGLELIEIQKIMHHKNPLSCMAYLKPTYEEVNDKLRGIK
ncbi:gamma-mobile-trio recombinase GmtY [Acinetobacter pittii]|uniref:gamma-mobile-trio recombinase GmtY n=1 Tax=Acinetobacter pittii TaxID=48296 RepID=UPI00062A8C15|nr:gamma-mobile-trio recombinase GmtY [Acinetobacter pittii]TGU85401.1 site-specific integrase [Acinetobacter pittii]